MLAVAILIIQLAQFATCVALDVRAAAAHDEMRAALIQDGNQLLDWVADENWDESTQCLL